MSNIEKQTLLDELLESGKFDDARRLLERELESGRVLDPRTDRLWAPIADRVASTLQGASGLDATLEFWEALLDFFVHVIEPVWGHAHKGHIHFRLGFAFARRDFERALREFRLAYAEDVIQETAKGGSQEEILERSYRYSGYVALTILERIDDADFDSTSDKRLFVDGLFGPSFDAAIRGETVRPQLVRDALSAIAPAQAHATCHALYGELSDAASRHLPFATVSLTGSVLESLLLAELHYRRRLTKVSGGRDIFRVELGPLLQEAISRSIFPSQAVQAAFRLVHIFRNRLHPGNELRQKHRLVPRVSATLKILFDLAAIEWAHELP